MEGLDAFTLAKSDPAEEELATTDGCSGMARQVSEDDASETSELSSVASMGRQITELTEAHCCDIMDRQCSGFQNRATEFWVRQNTVPALRQNMDCLDAMRRQISCPEPGPMPGKGFCTKLEQIQDSPDQTPFGSRQVSKQDSEDVVDFGLLETAVCVVVSECNFSVSVSDPWSLDSDLIAVSEGFVRMTGYSREDVIGENCRFLSEGCHAAPEERQRLKHAVETGSTYVGLLVNRKHSGEPFLNLLDLRGLVIARNPHTCEEIWVPLAVQMDVSDMAPESIPDNHFTILNQVAGRIRKRLLKNLAELGLGGILGQFKMQTKNKKQQARDSQSGADASADDSGNGGSWYLLMDTHWRFAEKPGPVWKLAPGESLPDLARLRQELPPLIGLSRRISGGVPITEGAEAAAAPAPALAAAAVPTTAPRPAGAHPPTSAGSRTADAAAELVCGSGPAPAQRAAPAPEAAQVGGSSVSPDVAPEATLAAEKARSTALPSGLGLAVASALSLGAVAALLALRSRRADR